MHLPPQVPRHLPNLCPSLWCCVWTHRTLTRPLALCSMHTSAKRPSLSSSLPGWHQTEKSKHRRSCQAQHPLSTQRQQSQALHILRLDALGWVILQEAMVTGQLLSSAVMLDKWHGFRRRLLPCIQNKVWHRNAPASREPAAEGAHCARGKTPGTVLSEA